MGIRRQGGGLEATEFAWGSGYTDGKPMANFWQVIFPWQNLKTDGYEGTSPVGAFPPNGYGFIDRSGTFGSGRPTGIA